MNKQTFKLLECIITNEGHPLAIDELMDIFQVSSRSFYNYWEEIYNFLCIINSQRLVVFNNHEFWFNGNEEDLNFLKISMSSLSFYEYRLSSEERKNIIMILLAASDMPIKSVYFEDILCVSRNTTIADLKEVAKMVEKFGVKISDNKRNGTSILANEKKRREIILSCLDYLDVEDSFFANSILNPCVTFLNQYLKFDKYRNMVENAVLQTEDKLMIKLPDRHFYQLVFVLIIFIQRIESGHLIGTEEVLETDNKELSSFIHEIFCFLGEDFKNNEKEIAYLIQFCLDRNLASHIIKSKDNPRYMSLLIQDLLYDIQPNYKQNLVDDTILNEFLIAHINVCYHRTNSGKKTINPFLSNIRVQYAEDFERLKSSIYILENGLNISLNDNEIAYILMHILASVERNIAQNRVLNVLVACSAGIATGNLLGALIKKNFNVNIAAISSTHDIKSIVEEKQIDLIVSTVPIENVKVPAITVNAILTERDIAKIHNHIILENSKASIVPSKEVMNQDKERKRMNITFLDLLSKNAIDLKGEATNWQEAIIAAGEILLWNNNITANYIHEMVQMVEKFGPYIVIAPGVAIAHAQPDSGTIKPGVSIVRFDKPIVFGKEEFDPVEVVVACAIFDTQEYINALLQLMMALRKPGFVKVVKKARKADDIIHVLEGLCINIVNKKSGAL